jgi:hypothetical protein
MYKKYTVLGYTALICTEIKKYIMGWIIKRGLQRLYAYIYETNGDVNDIKRLAFIIDNWLEQSILDFPDNFFWQVI